MQPRWVHTALTAWSAPAASRDDSEALAVDPHNFALTALELGGGLGRLVAAEAVADQPFRVVSALRHQGREGLRLEPAGVEKL